MKKRRIPRGEPRFKVWLLLSEVRSNLKQFGSATVFASEEITRKINTDKRAIAATIIAHTPRVRRLQRKLVGAAAQAVRDKRERYRNGRVAKMID